VATYLERLTAYAQRVVDGIEVAGLYERLACKRFFKDLARQGTAEFPYVIDDRLGARECYFLELLPHIKGEWAKPVYVDGAFKYAKLQLEDWQIFIEYQLFAWVHVATRLRRYRRSYEEIARKNAKSTRGAGRQLYLLTADGEPGAHCYSAATTGEQAREVFDVARNMALREPEFLQRFGVDVGKHDITVPDKASSFKGLHAGRPERPRRPGRRGARAQAPRSVGRAGHGHRRAVAGAAQRDHDGRQQPRRHLLRAAGLHHQGAAGRGGRRELVRDHLHDR
jgi:hypothetical protein